MFVLNLDSVKNWINREKIKYINTFLGGGEEDIFSEQFI